MNVSGGQTNYTANLSALSDGPITSSLLLNTDSAWRKISQYEPEDRRREYLLRKLDPQYPWYWSAAVLAILFGLSACTLNYRVRSLDRLR